MLLYRKQDKQGNFFAPVNLKVGYQGQTGVYIVYTDIFENPLYPCQNGKELSKNTLDILRLMV